MARKDRTRPRAGKSAPTVIDPHGLYSQGEAIRLLRMDGAVFRAEERAGRIRSRPDRNRKLYLGEWLLDWVRQGSRQAQGASTTATTPANEEARP